jgi:photosystem II stability/assembly factor-like uncharacterized protein
MGMKTMSLSKTKYLLAVFLMFVGVLLTCYTAVGKARRGDIRDASSETAYSAGEDDEDPGYLAKRQEFLDQFFGTGPGGVSPSAYAIALAAARSLPASPLLQDRRFVSPETLEVVAPFTSPILPPIRNGYGGNASAMVQALAIDPTNANVVYAGSFGGLAKTTDAGVTWRYLSDAWDSQSVSAIAVNPNASSIVYAGTGRDGGGYGSYEVGLYRSFDGGATWSSPLGRINFAETYMRTIAIDPNTSNVLTTSLYVANSCTGICGLWRSTDSGATWTGLRQVQHGIYDVAIDSATYPSTLYVTEDGGVFKSTDSGKSWTFIHGVPANSRNRLSVVNSTLYLMAPGDPNHNLYKSVDRGATWIQILTSTFSVFAVDPANPQTILGGNTALYRTDNEGLTWTQITGPIHPDQRVIAFSRSALGVVYDGNDGGVVRSTDAGRQWTNLNQNLPGALLYSVALSQDGSMMAGTQDNGAVFSNAGAPWQMVLGGDSNHDLIDPVGRTWAYALGYVVTPARDIANAFQRVNRAPPYQKTSISPVALASDGGCAFFPTFSMNPSSPGHLIAACQHVVRTLDGTASPVLWTPIGGSLADPSRLPDAYGNYVTAAYQAPSNTNVIYAVREWNTVFVTSNADQGDGATWRQVTQKNHPGGIHAVTVDPTNYQIAYLACDSGVYKTTDMGLTWTQQGVPDLFYNDVAIDPANPQHIFAASNAGVFASTDGGRQWGDMSAGIPAGLKVSGLSFNAISRQLAASTYGRGVYMVNLGSPSVNVSSSANLATALGL